MLYKLVSFFITLSLLMACHTANEPDEKGLWIDISETPPYNGYYLIDDKIHGIDHLNFPDSISLATILSICVDPANELWYVDIPTFKVCVNSDNERYAKDSKHVYHPNVAADIWLVESDKYPYSYTEYGGDLIILNADPKTFKYIGKGYAVDKKHMYFQGKRIEWSDSIIQALKTYGDKK